MEIQNVTLLSNNISETKAFYRNILGLKITKEDQSSVSLIAGETALTFIHMAGIQPVYHFAFNIPHNQLHEVLEYLQKSVEIMPVTDKGDLIANFKNWNAKSIYFNDNNGNILECIARFDLDNDQRAFDLHNFILNISEIGFVVKNVPEAQNMLHQMGIPLYDRGPQEVDFSVLGDDNGLIILKGIKSGWMPNNLPPHPYNVQTIIKYNEQKFFITLEDGELLCENVS